MKASDGHGTPAAVRRPSKRLLIIVLIGTVVLIAMWRGTKKMDRFAEEYDRRIQAQVDAVREQQRKQEEAFRAMTPAEHLAAARIPGTATNARRDEAIKHLSVITKTSAAYPQAVKMLRALEKAKQAAFAAAEKQTRQAAPAPEPQPQRAPPGPGEGRYGTLASGAGLVLLEAGADRFAVVDGASVQELPPSFGDITSGRKRVRVLEGTFAGREGSVSYEWFHPQ